MYLLGYDIGSSSIKAALVNADTGDPIGVTQYPTSEMEITSIHNGWAEQEPDLWWENLVQATAALLSTYDIDPEEIGGIGIAYQMHGLVMIDKHHQVIRPSIIWCDSRAVEIGDRAFEALGPEYCLKHLLNSPGNFTASKLAWVKENEPQLYQKVYKIMLPGDYIAMRLTGEINTTVSGMSEGMFWDFDKDQLASFLLDYYHLDAGVIPDIVPTFSDQGRLSASAAKILALKPGIPIGYRAGDQPNNALSLNVLNPGEVAATGGTSGVVYGVVDQPVYDPSMRVNGFAHVNHTSEKPSIGILLCINGAGIQYSWMHQHVGKGNYTYQQMESMAEKVSVGADGLRLIPFGNGAERMLENKSIGSQLINLQLNRHSDEHLFRAALEGIAFSFVYGMEVLNTMGLSAELIKVGNDNLFQSAIFSNTIATLANSNIQLIETTGAIGAASAAGIAAGSFNSLEEALTSSKVVKEYHPMKETEAYQEAYLKWKSDLQHVLKTSN